MGPLCSTTLPVQNLFATILMVDFGKLEKRIKKKCKNERKQYICQIFFRQFSRKPGKRQWRYVALCGAIFLDFGKLEKRIKKVQK